MILFFARRPIRFDTIIGIRKWGVNEKGEKSSIRETAPRPKAFRARLDMLDIETPGPPGLTKNVNLLAGVPPFPFKITNNYGHFLKALTLAHTLQSLDGLPRRDGEQGPGKRERRSYFHSELEGTDDLDHRRKYLLDRSGSGHGVSQGGVPCEHRGRGHIFQVISDVRHIGRKLDHT